MIDEKHKLLNDGIKMSEITELDEKIELTVESILEEYDYEPEDKDGLCDALRDECYSHMSEFAQFEASDDSIKDIFYQIKSDFNQAPEGHSKTSLSIMIGRRSGLDKDPKAVKQDLVHISNLMLEEKYGRD